MKCKLLAIAAIGAVVSVLMAAGSVSANVPGPFDHAFSVTLSSYNNGDHPDATVNIKLGKAPGAPADDISFFHDASTTYTGLTPTTAAMGDEVGSIGFDIQTNAIVALAPTNNINPAGTGQPPTCSATTPSTLHPSVTGVKLWGAVKSSSSPVVSTAANPSPVPNTSNQDQVPDTANGGAPMAVTHIPDWYLPVLNALGISTAQVNSTVVSRAFGIAQVLTNYTSVNLVTVNPQNGSFLSVTVLSNPAAAYNPAGQTVSTCAPFESTVITKGLGLGHNWNCTDYLGNAVLGCSNPFTVPAGNTLSTINPSITTGSYAIALSAGANVDGDCVSTAVCPAYSAGQSPNNPLWANIDNCHADANTNLTDTNSDGIGDICAGGGSVWTNVSAGAVANAAGPACASVVTAGPPWNACQDADGDGALNSVDNCPLTPNPTQLDADRDGIGDACDPQPSVPGTGTGWSSAFTPLGAGTYGMYDELCTQAFTIGPSGTAGAASCTNGGASSVVGRNDSNNDGLPDFVDTGTGNPCIQDHVADSNGDGYTDGDQAEPKVAPACTGAFPSTGLAQDPLSVFVTAGSKGPQSNGCYEDPLMAKVDVNLDGGVGTPDLASVGKNFGAIWVNNSDKVAETDMNGDHGIGTPDLANVGKKFGKVLTIDCVGQSGTKKLDSFTNTNTYTIAWDRLTTGNHTVALTCTGPTVNISQVVVGPSGKVVYPGIPSTAVCTATVDGNNAPIT